MSQEPENLTQSANWKQLLSSLGREEFQLREMERLGFWPPTPEIAAQTADARAQLRALEEQFAPLRKRERELKDEIAKAGNIPALLAEIRTRRIERVKAERAARKTRRAQEAVERAEKDKTWRAQTLPHLGREVSRGLKYDGGDDAKLRVLDVPLLHSAQDVATALQIETSELAWLCYHRGATSVDHYNHFTIPKKSGGTRQISSPKKKLRHAQSWLLENVLSKVPVHDAAMAFRAGKSIAHNAQIHAGANVILRIDFKDFFPSITFKRVKWMFESLGFNEGVSTLFALISTESPRVELTLDGQKHHVAVTQRFLPQGACTSPAITNILCRVLDKRLAGAAQKLKFVYTRYADDLVFSSKYEKHDARAMRDLATKIIGEEKFEINHEKTAILRAQNRQTVTGLVVNAQNAVDGKPRLSRRDIRRFRAFLHQYELRGREAMTEKIGQDSLSYARGYLSFIHMVSAEQEAQICAKHSWLERREI